MAPAICRMWADLYDDTWVWEGTSLAEIEPNKTKLLMLIVM